jgi:acetylornithine deacetylase/succinyl-diaminopimelate desuccinylase-like protein
MKTVAGAAAVFAVVSAAFLARLFAQDPHANLIADLLKDPLVKASLDTARAGETRAIEDQIRFCEVPAPTFKEAARGELLRQTFQQLGLRNVRVDKVGNVLGDRPGAAPRPRLVLSAHLDTVFGDETGVRVTRDGPILRGPGIGDDCRGLAVMVGTIRMLRQTNLQTPGTVTFVATVGEEGLGDLRGVKQLFKETLAGEVDRFVSIDGTGLGVTNVGVGSLRYRVTFKGPGGHSFAAFGLANPIDALGRAIAKIADFQVSAEPKTTFNVGRVGGGTSVNSIPSDAWMEVDMRSSAPASLAALDARFQKAIDAAVAEENDRWRTPRVVTALKERVGDRPAGSTPADSPIVRTVEAVQRTLGLPTTFSESSTDSNIPMSLHIPAVTIGGGGRGIGAHAAAESFDTTDSWRGAERALLLTIALAQK